MFTKLFPGERLNFNNFNDQMYEYHRKMYPEIDLENFTITHSEYMAFSRIYLSRLTSFVAKELIRSLKSDTMVDYSEFCEFIINKMRWVTGDVFGDHQVTESDFHETNGKLSDLISEIEENATIMFSAGGYSRFMIKFNEETVVFLITSNTLKKDEADKIFEDTTAEYKIFEMENNKETKLVLRRYLFIQRFEGIPKFVMEIQSDYIRNGISLVDEDDNN